MTEVKHFLTVFYGAFFSIIRSAKVLKILSCAPDTFALLWKSIENPPALRNSERKSGFCDPGARSSPALRRDADFGRFGRFQWFRPNTFEEKVRIWPSC